MMDLAGTSNIKESKNTMFGVSASKRMKKNKE